MTFRHRTRAALRSRPVQLALSFPTSVPDPAYKAALVAQIARDMATLRMPRDFHQPSTAFYEERMTMYREACRRCA
jgi:hypothetical protein